MDERDARRVLMVRAVETTFGADNPDWSRDDRAWAQRSALEAVGADAPADVFVASRAAAALQRLGQRLKALPAWAEPRGWRLRWVALVAAAVFALGVLADSLGSGQQINLMAPAVWGVLVWNLIVYAAMAASMLWRRSPRRGWSMRTVETLRERLAAPADAGGSVQAVLHTFGTTWLDAGAALRHARWATLLHASAAALAVGLITGMYLRGLVLDYQASWQSTFLNATQVHALLGALFAPALALTGQSFPNVHEFATLRGPDGGASAAPWIHLIATTLGVAVVLPRGLFALLAHWRSRRYAQRVALPLATDPYYQRLLQQQRGGRTQLTVRPYAKAPDASAALGLRAVLAEVFGDAVHVDVAPTTPYGDEDGAAAMPEAATDPVIVLFDLNATPEAETHGRFIEQLGPRAVTVIDESGFRQRFGAAAGERLKQRRAAWRELPALLQRPPLFIDLESPDVDGAAKALRAALGR